MAEADPGTDDPLDDRVRVARPARTAPGSPPPEVPEIARGVERLIADLRERGVEAGRREAEARVAEARGEAERIRADAEAEAAGLVARARDEASRLRASGEEALRTAARDAMLALRADFLERFSDSVRRMVHEALDSRELLAAMILALVRRTGEAAGTAHADRLEIDLPDRPQTLEDLRADLEEARRSPLTRLVLAGVAETLREGVELRAGAHDRAGIRVRLADGGIEIDLSDEAIAAALLAHLRPRFRALFEGIIT